MSDKPHILIAESPLRAGEDQTALCGEVVKNARFELAVDGDLSGADFRAALPKNTCWRCLKAKRYVYVLVAGRDEQ